MTPQDGNKRDSIEDNPNSLHDIHIAKRGPKNIPKMVVPLSNAPEHQAKDPGHPYAQAKHMKFDFFDQRISNAPFGYEHFVSLPPSYEQDLDKRWPLILFLHGAGESQRGKNESFASIRHGIPKVVLCYDKLKSNPNSSEDPSIEIPLAPRLRKSKQTGQGDRSTQPVPRETCELVAENFITVTPSLNMDNGYGWDAAVLSALLDEIVERYRVDADRIHITGFSMGGYGTWDLALHSPKRFATLSPICGGGDRLRAVHIKHVPHWVFHGDQDDIIPVKASIQMVEALEKADAREVKFKRYPDLKHDSWTPTYNEPELYRWMLSHKREVSGDEEVVPKENKIVLGEENA
ncbi:hypothetical protein H2200_007634 [Cladophialophora chaetospira]|uniref:Phospholipase/carboxylesterase/thioesterase domain-containing protein n=1 Tax=Cladophialophora chaetospira TaxID=386627 RepID=A0AA39CG99_9EURO|nr:hypothetical protein H2200_007634 [Cladophialophora chaetospira]